MAKQETSWQVGAYRIELTPKKKFLVVETEREYDSYDKADEAIQRVVAAEGKTKRKTVSLPCVQFDRFSEKATPCTITGIHAGDSNLLGDGVIKGYSRQKLYPDHPTVKSAIDAVLQATKAVHCAEQRLLKFEVPHNTYGGETHVELLDKFEANYRAKLKLAEKKGVAK